jgi:hypothetical protein
VTTLALPERPEDWRTRLWQRTTGVLLAAVGIAAGIGRSTARPIAAHLRDHIYSIIGIGFIDAAAFTHSLFTGLLVTGISFLIFEWKVSDEGDSRS